MKSLIKRIKNRIRYYTKRYDMPKTVAVEIVLSDFSHYKQFNKIKGEIK